MCENFPKQVMLSQVSGVENYSPNVYEFLQAVENSFSQTEVLDNATDSSATSSV